MILENQRMNNHIQFEKWTADQVAEWLTGLDMDDAMIPYMHYFRNSGVDGKKLMLMTHADLEKLNVVKFGHQELILEAIDLLRNLRYSYETENLQSLALQLGCKARSLKGEMKARTGENDRNRGNVSQSDVPARRLTIGILSSVADLVATLKTLVAWMDKAPFCGYHELCLVRNTIVKLGLELINMCQREATIPDIETNVKNTTTMLSEICVKLVIGSPESQLDPLYLQPASLEQATIRKKQGEELGMHIQSSYYGVHVISGIKDMSPADLCGKIEKGDEVIQVNSQIVAGWSLKKLVNLLKENPKEVMLFLKKRPRHIAPYGQMPNKKKHEVQASTLPKSRKKLRSRDGDSQKSQLLRPTMPEYHPDNTADETEDLDSPKETNDGNDTDNDVFRSGSESPQFSQYTLPVQSDPKQRRATVSGGSPILTRPLLVIEDIDTPSRPKSFTIATSAGNMPHEIIINSPSGENLTDMNKLASAMDKRHEYKTKSTPPSLEFSVRKPTPKIIEPMDSLDQKDVKEEGSEKGETTVIVTAPGEVTVVTPTEEQTAEKVAVSAADGINTAPSKETGGEDKDKHTHKPTVEPATGAPLHADIDRCSQSPERLLDSSTDSVPPSESSMESSQTYTSSLESSSHSPPLDESSLSSEKETSDGPLFISGPRVIEAPRAQRTPPTRRVQNFEVASESYAKNQPQLMKIRKIDSVHMHDRERSPVKKEGSGKHVGFVGVEPEPEDTNSYVCKIVGGVVQKIPVDTKKSPSQSPVQIRPKTGKGRKVNRRVSCKDLGQGDCQGWLFKRRSKGGSLLHSPWQRRWCVIKEYSLFYFHDNEAIKAEGVIHLPAFQVSPVDASEVKTKKFAFKIHNRGTSFCFASDRQEDMKKWMNKMGLAAISFHESRVDVRKRETSPSRYHDPDFSESDTDDTSAVSSREPSPARSTRGAAGSNQSSPQISRAERLRPASPDMRSSQEDLSVMMRRQSQRGQNIFGEDKNKQRRTAISRDMETLVTPEVIAYKKKKALERTLRAKVKELEELELALVAKEKLHTYQDLLNKLDSDAD